LLFLIYVNDMFRADDKGKIRLFADDTNIFVIASDLRVLFTLANEIVNNVYQWLVCNKLTINFDKTNYMIFKPTSIINNEITNLNLSLNINNVLLDRTSSTKYLGVWLDEKLNWDIHVAQLIKKINSLIGILYRKKYLLPMHCRRNIYYSLAYSSLIYCIEVYGAARQSVLNPLIVKCNLLLRVLQDQPRCYSVKELYNHYQTLPVNLLYKLFILKLMYRVLYCTSLLPNVVSELFKLNSNIHTHNTRSKHEFNIQANACVYSISFIGPSMWFKIPKVIRECSSVSIFIRKCKIYLLDEF